LGVPVWYTAAAPRPPFEGTRITRSGFIIHLERIHFLSKKGDSMKRLRRLAPLALVFAAMLSLGDRVAALEVGQKAPDFNLPGSKGQEVKLSELTAKGPVVVYTLIQAFTPT
jgi:hypothetical protein